MKGTNMRFAVELPDELARRFKATAALRGEAMGTAARRLIEGYASTALDPKALRATEWALVHEDGHTLPVPQLDLGDSDHGGRPYQTMAEFHADDEIDLGIIDTSPEAAAFIEAQASVALDLEGGAVTMTETKAKALQAAKGIPGVQVGFNPAPKPKRGK